MRCALDLPPEIRNRRKRGQRARKVPSRDEAEVEEIRRECLASLAAFVRWAWPLLNPGTRMRWGRHIDAICQQLEAVTEGRAARITVVNVPPGHCKTTIISVCWPVWEWLRAPHHRWIFATHSQANAIKDNEARRDLLESSAFLALFRPELADAERAVGAFQATAFPKNYRRARVRPRGRPGWRLAAGKNLKSRFANSLRGSMRALSVGTRVTGDHADRLVIDDPIDAGDLGGPQLAGHVAWYNDKLSTRTREDTRVVLVMQRLHEVDLSGVLVAEARELGTLGKIEGVDLLIFPSHYAPGDELRQSCTVSGWRDWRTREGELLWPEYRDEAFLQERQRRMTPTAYACQFEQDTVVVDGMMFNPEWWRFWDALPLDRRCRWYLSVDTTTGSTTDDADFTVIQAWLLAGNDLFLVHQRRDKWTGPQILDEAKGMLAAHPLVGDILIEQKAGGLMLIQNLVADGIPEGRIKGIKPKQAPEHRADAASVGVRAGRVWLPRKPLPGFDVPGFIEEHRRFPRAAKTDQVSATEQMINHVMPHLMGRGAVSLTGILRANPTGAR